MFTKEEIKKIAVIGILIIGGIIAYHLFDNFGETISFVQRFISMFTPIIAGFVIAYIVNIPMMSVEGVIFRKSKWSAKTKRVFSLLITVFILFVFLTIIFSFAIPQLKDSLDQLMDQAPGVAVEASKFLQDQFNQMNIGEDVTAQAEELWTNLRDSIASFMLSLSNSTVSFVSRFISGIFNAILSIVLAAYMLLSKESLIRTVKKFFYAFTPKRFAMGAGYYVDKLNISFESFIRGQMLEAVILGVFCYIGMLIFRFEYPLLISVLVGLTNIIPLFGPYIGGIPSFLLLLMVNPIQALWFIVYLSVLQQLESNLIYPRVVGSSMGMSGFWIMIAVIVGNNFFGILGILIGIPLLSTLYVVVGDLARRRLKEKKIKVT